MTTNILVVGIDHGRQQQPWEERPSLHDFQGRKGRLCTEHALNPARARVVFLCAMLNKAREGWVGAPVAESAHRTVPYTWALLSVVQDLGLTLRARAKHKSTPKKSIFREIPKFSRQISESDSSKVSNFGLVFLLRELRSGIDLLPLVLLDLDGFGTL